MGYKQNGPGPVGIQLGRRIYAMRTARGWTRNDLADLVARQGRPLAPMIVARIELGLRRIDVDDLQALAGAFGMSASALLRRAAR